MYINFDKNRITSDNWLVTDLLIAYYYMYSPGEGSDGNAGPCVHKL